jgi:hypothetical protein
MAGRAHQTGAVEVGARWGDLNSDALAAGAGRRRDERGRKPRHGGVEDSNRVRCPCPTCRTTHSYADHHHHGRCHTGAGDMALRTPHIPRGKVTLLEGDPGQGKTWLALATAAAVKRSHPIQE